MDGVSVRGLEGMDAKLGSRGEVWLKVDVVWSLSPTVDEVRREWSGHPPGGFISSFPLREIQLKSHLDLIQGFSDVPSKRPTTGSKDTTRAVGVGWRAERRQGCPQTESVREACVELEAFG